MEEKEKWYKTKTGQKVIHFIVAGILSVAFFKIFSLPIVQNLVQSII